MFKLKPPTTFEEQLSILESRGMIISDRKAALRALQNENYYRLSGYTFHLKKSPATEEFKAGSTFDNVLVSYCYDKELRVILFKYLDMVEVRLRAQIAYFFSHACGSYGHYNCINFTSEEACDDFSESLLKAIKKNKDAAFVRQHINKYSDLSIDPPIYNMPLWAAVEIISLSTLSKFYKSIGLPTVKNDIANALQVSQARLDNWLHAIACLHNICAHYGRIYNQTLHPAVSYSQLFYISLKPLQLKTDRFFGYIPAMLALLPDEGTRKQFLSELKTLNAAYFAKIDKQLLGYPDDWSQYFSKWESINTLVL